MHTRNIVLVAGILALIGSPSFAADDPKTQYVPDAIESKKEEIKHKGWDGSLNVGASTAVSHSSKVTGRIDGTSFTFGAQLQGGLMYIKGPHEWRNTLGYGVTYTRTPALEAFIKTNDELVLESIYLYHFKRVKWLGPFAQLVITLPFFPGEDVRAWGDAVDDTGQLRYTDEDGNSISAGDDRFDGSREDNIARLLLTDPFIPLRLKQSAGFFAMPVDKERLKLEIKLGFAGRQTFADGQLAINDDADTDPIEIQRLSDIYQAGPSAAVTASGQLSKKKVSYAALAEAMLPVLNNQTDSDDRSIGKLTNVHLELNISFKLVSWASLDYQFRALYEPQLFDEFQLQNNLLLTFSYTLLEAANS
jgi:hypothetical protein